MKTFYIFALLCALCVSAFAQTTTVTLPRNTKFFVWDEEAGSSGDWEYASDYFTTYNSKGHIAELLLKTGDINLSRTVNTFGDFSKLTQSLNQSWSMLDNSWKDNLKTTYTFDAQGRVSTVTNQTSFGTMPLANSVKSIYSYTGTSVNPSSILHQAWDATSNTWKDDTKDINITWSADNPNGLTGYVEQEWQNNAWVNVERFTSTYNATTRKATETLEEANGSGWVNSTRSTYTYDTHKTMIGVLEQEWDGSAWAFDSETQLVITYNPSNVMTERITKTKDAASAPFENAYKEVFSDFQTITITSSPEQLPASALAVFPNPATNALQVSLKGVEFKEAKVELFNLQGQKVYDSGVTQKALTGGTHEINTSHLAPGIYLLHVRTNNQKEIARRIIKQ